MAVAAAEAALDEASRDRARAEARLGEAQRLLAAATVGLVTANRFSFSAGRQDVAARTLDLDRRARVLVVPEGSPAHQAGAPRSAEQRRSQ